MKKSLLFITFYFITFFYAFAQTDAFIAKWKIESNYLNLIIIASTDYSYNYDIDWGDGTTDTGVTLNKAHTYAQAGEYTTKITGTFPKIEFSGNTQLIDIEQWGTTKWASMENSFKSCTSFTSISATDLPDLSNVENMKGMFLQASSFNGNISNWNVSNVNNMFQMFFQAVSFNGDLNNWNVSFVTNMNSMFSGASSFNGDLSNWNVSSVTNMESMFSGASSFNKDLSNWDVSAVTSVKNMFLQAVSFNGDINNWDVSSVTNFDRMFSGASSFNSDISNWNFSTTNEIRMVSIFYNAISFNQDLSNWNVGSVTSMNSMFSGASSFNGNISSWDVGAVTNMGFMFFDASSFNQDLSNWNVGSVTKMTQMFSGASSFDGDLSNWDVTSVSNMVSMFLDITLSTENYDALLVGWSQLSLKSKVIFNGGNSQYCAGEAARQKMIDDFEWTITDGERDSECTLGVENEELAQSLKMYPNPTEESLIFESKLPIEKIEIYSFSGKKIKNILANFRVISTNYLRSGIYMVKIYTEKGVAMRKLIKQ